MVLYNRTIALESMVLLLTIGIAGMAMFDGFSMVFNGFQWQQIFGQTMEWWRSIYQAGTKDQCKVEGAESWGWAYIGCAQNLSWIYALSKLDMCTIGNVAQSWIGLSTICSVAGLLLVEGRRHGGITNQCKTFLISAAHCSYTAASARVHCSNS